jgi:hypothetical protein
MRDLLSLSLWGRRGKEREEAEILSLLIGERSDREEGEEYVRNEKRRENEREEGRREKRVIWVVFLLLFGWYS